MNNKHLIFAGMTFFFILSAMFIADKHSERMKDLEIDILSISPQVITDTQALEELATKTKKHW